MSHALSKGSGDPGRSRPLPESRDHAREKPARQVEAAQIRGGSGGENWVMKIKGLPETTGQSWIKTSKSGCQYCQWGHSDGWVTFGLGGGYGFISQRARTVPFPLADVAHASPPRKQASVAGICSKRHRLSGQAAGQVPWRPGGHSRAGCGLSGCGTGRPTQLEPSGTLMVGSLPACVQA